MFEDSLVESRIVFVSPRKRWTTIVSIGLQCTVAAAIVALPLLHPEALPFRVDSPKVLLPVPPRAPVQVVRVEHAASSTDSAAVAPVMTRATILPSLSHTRGAATSDAPPVASIDSMEGMGSSDAFSSAMSAVAEHGPGVSVVPARASQRLHVSSGVSLGLLLAPIRPVYPAIAKAAQIEGTVVVEAVISKTGSIESLHVVSGPAMLQGAAIEAIRAARYQPYRLNGEPTEVQTTITVNFRLGG